MTYYTSFSRRVVGTTTICSCVAKVPCACPHLPLLWDAGHRQWTATSLPSGTKADVVGLGGNSEGEMTSEQLAEAWGRYETPCVKIFAGWTTWRLHYCIWIYLMSLFLAESGWSMVLMFLDGVQYNSDNWIPVWTQHSARVCRAQCRVICFGKIEPVH